MGKKGSKRRAAHFLGHETISKKQLDEVVLPTKITCRHCKRSRTATIGFSTLQLDDFKRGIATRKITHETESDPCWIACKDCTNRTKTEMLCARCQHWLGLDGFTKAQRRTPDHATCKECVYKNQTTAPIIAAGKDTLMDLSDDDESTDSDDDKTNPYEQSDAGVPLPETSYNLNEANLKSLPSHASGPSAWQHYARSGEATGQKYTAYDPEGHAHTKFYSPSVADTEDSRAPTGALRLTERETKDLTSKFAKLRGPRQELAPPAPYLGGRAVADEDDEDSDDSYGYM